MGIIVVPQTNNNIKIATASWRPQAGDWCVDTDIPNHDRGGPDDCRILKFGLQVCLLDVKSFLACRHPVIMPVADKSRWFSLKQPPFAHKKVFVEARYNNGSACFLPRHPRPRPDCVYTYANTIHLVGVAIAPYSFSCSSLVPPVALHFLL